MKMNSVMPPQHQFSTIPGDQKPRARFDRSHGHKTTFDAGLLIPILVDEVLPGDQFKLNTASMCRLATPIKPVLDNLHMDTHFFFVPTRLLWDNFQKFMGEQDDPGDSIDFLIPQTSATNFLQGSLADYMGVPIASAIEQHVVNSLPFRAYSLIYNEWFRDENLQNKAPFTKSDGPDAPTVHFPNNPLRRGKRHDYFTSCLPSPQKGDPVSLSLGGTAPVHGIGIRTPGTFSPTTNTYLESGKTGTTTNESWQIDTTAASGDELFFVKALNGTGPRPDITADLSEATAVTINDLRYAVAAQQFLERDQRGGTRYTELIRSHFGVISPDARLQRPEYLGGGSTPITINPVAQTTSTDATTPQGNLAAIGTASFSGHGFNKGFTEHGYIIGLASVRADLTYQRGLNKLWSRQERFDFYWPTFAHLGEQEVLNKEIYMQGDNSDDLVFGYQERYAEYRYKPSLITGKMRSDDPQSLDVWHLSQDFGSLPVLNSSFIEEDPPIDRIVATPDEPHILADFYFDYKCVRPIPMYSVPGLMRL